MKKLVALIISLILIFTALSAFAANPSAFSPDARGNSENLVVVKKPETKNSATLKKTYGVTGTGKSGVKVAYYKFNGTSYIALSDANGSMSQTTIGTAGVFYKQVALSEGHNKFAVRAEAPGGTYQIVYFDINVLNQNMLNNINGFSNGIQNLYNGWMK